eukprot:6187839-Pleurochrysis_carterae.AAC.1
MNSRGRRRAVVRRRGHVDGGDDSLKSGRVADVVGETSPATGLASSSAVAGVEGNALSSESFTTLLVFFRASEASARSRRVALRRSQRSLLLCMRHSHASTSRSSSSGQMFSNGLYGRSASSSDSLVLGSSRTSCSRSSRALAASSSSRRFSSAISCSQSSLAVSLGSRPGGAWRAPAASSSWMVMSGAGDAAGAAMSEPRAQSALPRLESEEKSRRSVSVRSGFSRSERAWSKGSPAEASATVPVCVASLPAGLPAVRSLAFLNLLGHSRFQWGPSQCRQRA